MAMRTQAEKQQSALERRIRGFYDSLNGRDFERCHRMIDPRLRDAPASVTLFQYGNALRQFLDQFGSLNVMEVQFTLHLNEPNKLYEGRDFAVGKTVWSDQAGEWHAFSERWVRNGRAWYTRSTGFITPKTQPSTPPTTQREALPHSDSEAPKVRRGRRISNRVPDRLT